MLLPLAPNDCPSTGGVRALRLWPAGNVRPLPAYVGSSLSTAISLVDATNYADVWFLPDLAGFEEPESDEGHGPLYKPTLSLALSRDAPDLQEALDRLRAVRWFVAAYEDANGLTKLVGTPDYPLRLLAGLETGKRPGERNGYPVTLAGLTTRPAPFYLTQQVGEVPTRRAFSAGFTFGFS